MPPFVRIAWASAQARATWEPRVVGIRQAWQVLELISVREGLRSCALVTLSEGEFGRLHKRTQKYGLAFAELPPPTFQIQHPKNAHFVVLSVSGATLEDFQTAWHTADHKEMNHFLGYPACCLAAFQQNGAAQPVQDPIWHTALHTPGNTDDPHCREFKNDPRTNLLLTRLGLPPVLHPPCTFTCPATRTLADQFLHLGRDNHLSAEMDDLTTLLSWPMEWSALHGIAEIKTPILKISTHTVATAHKYTVRLTSVVFPEAGVHGMKFPYLG